LSEYLYRGDFGRKELRDQTNPRKQAAGRLSFEELFARFAPILFAWCAKRCGSREVARDFVSETFAIAWENRESFVDSERAAGPEGWLFGIARNLVSDYWRTQEIDARARRRLGVQLEDSEADHAERCGERITAAQWSAVLDQLLHELPTEQREIVNLYLLRGLSHQECAALAHTNPETTRKRLSRALQTLRARAEGSAL
jgi:RNA polymerase sigma factor (sigma-70 family)